jgi:hypothetical protein
MSEFEKTVENIALRLPELPEPSPKNIFDILGIRNKETSNSRILSYFFDINETHGLNSLFFDSLKKIIENKKYDESEFLSFFNGTFNVITENTTSFAETDTKKRIDISLIGSDKWGIIIENKLYHKVSNPLKAYWTHTANTCGDNIIGVLLTLHSLNLNNDIKHVTLKDGKKANYLNITHQELIVEIQNQLKLSDVKNLDGLVYLKEYIKTIESHYTSTMDEPKFNMLVSAITKQKDEIALIQKKVEETSKFIDVQIEETFSVYGYERVGSWFTNKTAKYPIYFYVPKGYEILMNNKLWFTIEYRDEINQAIRNQKKTKLLQTYFSEFLSNLPNIRLGTKSTSTYTHIAIFSMPNTAREENTIKMALQKTLKNHFMNNKGIVKKAEAFVEQEIFGN